MKSKTIILTVLIVVIIAAAAFFGGMQYQSSKSSTLGQGGQANFQRRFGNGTGGQGQFGGQGGNQAFRPVRGEILSMDSNTVTVKLNDGTSRIVILSGTTQFLKTLSGTKDDLKTGMTINAIGTQNTDGSVTAQDIQINPPNFGRGGVNPETTGNPANTQSQ